MNDDLPPEPYVGLTPFEERHASFFFGRERERRLLAASILSSRLTLLYGQSGVGKSSLLRAGLVRDFREQADRALERGRLPTSLLVVFADWRDDPLPALAAAVESAVRDQLGELAPEPPPAAPGLDELLLAWTRRLDERAAVLAPDRRQTPHELLLVLDQFEEYFLYHGDEGLEGTFGVEFPRAVMREDLRASFLIAIREDAYTQLDRFEGRIRNLFSSNFRLEHLDERAARAAIEGPVARYNELLPDSEEPYAIEPALIEAVLQQVRTGSFAVGQSGAGASEADGRGEVRVATPFLQLVMTRLWDEERDAASRTLRLATLERLGGAERLVRGHLEQALGDLAPDARALVADVFGQLVTPSGTKIVHTLPDLAAYAHTTEEELSPALRTLTERRILRPVDPPPGATSPRFEIFHDVLAPAILDWRAGHELAEEHAAQAERHRRARRRLAAISGGSLVLVLVFAGLAVWALAQRRHAGDQERAARAQAQAARAAEAVARSQALAASSVSQLDADPELALLLAIKAGEEDKTPEAEAAVRRAIGEQRLRGVYQTGRVRSVSAPPSGHVVVTVGKDGRGRLWRASTAPVDLGKVTAASFDRVGSRLVTARSDGSARIVEPATGRETEVVHAGRQPLVEALFSRDGSRLLTIGRDGAARVWDLRTRRQLRVAEVQRPLAYFDVSPRGEAVLLAGGGRQLVWRWQEPTPPIRIRGARPGGVADDGRVWLASLVAYAPGLDPELTDWPVWILDPATRKRRTLNVPGGSGAAAFSPNGRMIATTGVGATARVWDTRTGAQIAVLRGHADAITNVSFSADGRTVLTGSMDGSARLWSVATEEPLGVFRGPPGNTLARFSAGGRFVATANADGKVRVWLADQEPTRSSTQLETTENSPISAVAWTHDRALLLAAASPNGIVYVLDGTTGRVRRAFPALSNPNGFAVFSPDGRLVARADGVYSSETGVRIWRSPNEIGSGTFRPDSSELAFVDSNGRLWLWSARTRRAQFLGRPGDAVRVGFTLAGDVLVEGYETTSVWPRSGGKPHRWKRGFYAAVARGGSLAATTSGRSVRLWRRDAPAGMLRGNEATQVSFSPDGKTVAAASLDGTARLWNLEKRTSIVLRGHVGHVDAIAFSPDGSLVVTGGADGSMRVWQTATGSSVAVYRPSHSSVLTVAFSPDGKLIASSSDRTVTVLDCEACRPFNELLALARSRVTRSFTEAERRQFLGEKSP